MEREILFRMWDGTKFQSVFKILWTEEGMIVFPREGHSALMPHNTKNISQYIGKEDRIGREIYDGDIIKIVDGNDCTHSLVKWSDQRGGWDMVRSEDGESMIDHYGFDVVSDGKIIGNKWDNPELLKQPTTE